jgi:transcriptional regulator with XRE-family HTH domain
MSRKKYANPEINARLRALVDSVSGGNAKEFAEKSGIPVSTFHEYMRGRDPSAEHMIRISGFCDVDLHWFITGEGSVARRNGAQATQNGADLSALIGMTAEILQSGTDYAESLAANIRSFHKSVEMERQLAALEDRWSADTEDRLEKLERMCEEIKANLETRRDEALGQPAKVAAGGG